MNTKNTNIRTKNEQADIAPVDGPAFTLDDKSAFVKIALRTSAAARPVIFPEPWFNYLSAVEPLYAPTLDRARESAIDHYRKRIRAMQGLRLLKDDDLVRALRGRSIASGPELSVVIRSPELKLLKKRDDHSVTTVMNIEFKHVTVWLDLDYVPSADDLANSQKICVEYEQADPAKLRKWLEAVRMVYFNYDIFTGGVVIFANYDALTSAEVAHLVGEFHELGAMFSGYPEGCKNFGCAIESYIDNIRKIGDRTAKFRREMSAPRVAEVSEETVTG